MNKKIKIFLGNDHAAYEQKEAIIKFLTNKGYDVVDLGAHPNEGRVDYPDYAFLVGNAVNKEKDSLGILLCGSGIGMCIASGKVKNIRPALLYNKEVAKLAKEHNNANVICFGVRNFSVNEINEMINNFLDAHFLGERHEERIEKIEDFESKNK
ncbi:RpiB/LacA/LacB family sugar-phosphate isomerase [Ureaplasma canigenitalium]|uniref:RpiB/LacA/LacB family sugar-phosphate isomerase n=1 Tax=Ureaplasma canigenitalium TaxID=42092 RepID=UPI0004E1F74E|nr:RpiB/LacA/LacB family sugar-phosphate isomerase [Ureaplasma canigenitalium]